MPQIAQILETWSSQVFWLLVFFGLTYFIIGRFMVPKVMDTVSVRDKQIADDLAAAQAAQDGAEEQEEAWRTRENENRAAAQSVIAKAKAVSAAKSEKKIAAAQKRLDTKMADAEVAISAARASAMKEVEGVAAEATQDIVSRLAGTKVTKAVAKKAVKEAMANA
jgi:F-type H+-transporting ATPase subunit b